MGIQSKAEIEEQAKTLDQWGYQTNPEDQRRKDIIVNICFTFLLDRWRGVNFSAANISEVVTLDIGAHEGWITKDLPGALYAYELSDNAAARFPPNVKRIFAEEIDDADFHLVTMTGVLYDHYDWPRMISLARRGLKDILITCNIKEWESPHAIAAIKEFADEIFTAEFPYREFKQKLRVFRRKGLE